MLWHEGIAAESSWQENRRKQNTEKENKMLN